MKLSRPLQRRPPRSVVRGPRLVSVQVWRRAACVSMSPPSAGPPPVRSGPTIAVLRCSRSSPSSGAPLPRWGRRGSRRTSWPGPIRRRQCLSDGPVCRFGINLPAGRPGRITRDHALRWRAALPQVAPDPRLAGRSRWAPARRPSRWARPGG